VVSFVDQDPVSSVQQIVIADDHVTMLVADDTCTASANELNEACKPSAESFVPFDDAECTDDTAHGAEYTEDEACQERLCMIGSVTDSYEGQTMITMDSVSVVCSEQNEPACVDEQELSSAHEQVLEHSG